MARSFGQSVHNELKVLDLGCGQGASSWFLAREGFQVHAIDGSESALTKAYLRLEKDGLDFSGVQCDMEKLPFEDKEFDAVVDVVASVHNSVEDIYVIFAEVARVLKPSGKLFSVMPTNICSRLPFFDYRTTFMDQTEINWLLKFDFQNIDILLSTYQLDHECTVELWIVTADRLGSIRRV